MAENVTILAEILAELEAIRTASFRSDFGKAEPELPSWINAGDGKSLTINRTVTGLIAELAENLYAANLQLHNVISHRDWLSLVTRVVGPILGAIDLDPPFDASADTALTALNYELVTTKWNFERRTFLFGCSFVNVKGIAPFSIGPVTIQPRNVWLEHALHRRLITEVTHRRLVRTWSGERVRRRRRSIDYSKERDIIDVVGAAPFVCSVETDGLFGDIAKEKALIAARLTTLGVALMWESTGKALQDMNLLYDGTPYRQTYAFYQEQCDILHGSRWRNSLHGLPLFGVEWISIIDDRKDWWMILSEVIDFILKDQHNLRRPGLMRVFAHALIWFYEGCREPMHMIAIPKFMSCLDALAGGRKANGIIALLSSTLKVTPDTPIRKDGPSFKVAINELYSEGRSRLLHGNSDRLGRDWENQRGLAESLARICLIQCFHWAAEHTTIDGPNWLTRPT